MTALEWLQRHVGSFGGDPARVTISGQSAGGTAACNMLLSPLRRVRGLFRRAVVQSGPCVGPWAAGTEGFGRQVMRATLDALNVSTLAELRC